MCSSHSRLVATLQYGMVLYFFDTSDRERVKKTKEFTLPLRAHNSERRDPTTSTNHPRDDVRCLNLGRWANHNQAAGWTVR